MVESITVKLPFCTSNVAKKGVQITNSNYINLQINLTDEVSIGKLSIKELLLLYSRLKDTVNLCLPFVPIFIFPLNLLPTISVTVPVYLNVIPLLVVSLRDINDGSIEYLV